MHIVKSYHKNIWHLVELNLFVIVQLTKLQDGLSKELKMHSRVTYRNLDTHNHSDPITFERLVFLKMLMLFKKIRKHAFF